MNISERTLLDEIREPYHFSPETSVSMLKVSENITFRVTDGDKKYALRLCRPAYHTRSELEAEMVWISDVANETDVKVASPVKNREGDYVTTIALGQQKFHCCLFPFLEGTVARELAFGSDGTIGDAIAQVGEITAQLHRQVQRHPSYLKLNRFEWNLDSLVFHAADRWGSWRNYHELTPETSELFARAEEICVKRLTAYGQAPDRYNLVHTDLSLNNIIIGRDGTCQVIDFDDCGKGWLLYDLSSSLLEFEDNLPDMQERWAEGYEKYRHLTEADRREMLTFHVLRRIVRLGWIETHIDSDTVQKIPATYYPCTIRLCEKFLEENG